MAAPDQSVFVRAVLKELGINMSDLGRRLGFKQPHTDVWRVMKGKKPLRYPEVIYLLEECGWLKTTAWNRLAAAAEADAQEYPPERSSIGTRRQAKACSTETSERVTACSVFTTSVSTAAASWSCNAPTPFAQPTSGH